MRINNTDGFAAFKSLNVANYKHLHLTSSNLKNCEKQLAKTKRFDVIIDTNGFSIKDRKTELLNWIQSFSLFVKEKAIGINLLGDSKTTMKIYYDNIDEAKKVWDDLCNTEKNNRLEGYTKTALILDKSL